MHGDLLFPNLALDSKKNAVNRIRSGVLVVFFSTEIFPNKHFASAQTNFLSSFNTTIIITTTTVFIVWISESGSGNVCDLVSIF